MKLPSNIYQLHDGTVSLLGLETMHRSTRLHRIYNYIRFRGSESQFYSPLLILHVLYLIISTYTENDLPFISKS
jgi:hypothetical protein